MDYWQPFLLLFVYHAGTYIYHARTLIPKQNRLVWIWFRMVSTQIEQLGYTKILSPWHTHQISVLTVITNLIPMGKFFDTIVVVYWYHGFIESYTNPILVSTPTQQTNACHLHLKTTKHYESICTFEWLCWSMFTTNLFVEDWVLDIFLTSEVIGEKGVVGGSVGVWVAHGCWWLHKHHVGHYMPYIHQNHQCLPTLLLDSLHNIVQDFAHQESICLQRAY